MEVPIAIGVLALAGILAVVALRVIGPLSSWRLRIPGVILAGLGLALFGSQMPPTPERLLFGLLLLAAWGVTGLGLITGRSWARVPGVLVSALGFGVAAWVTVRGDAWANELARSADRVLVDVFFLADGPHYSWIEVGAASMIFAILSAVAGGLLLTAVRGRSR